MNSDDSVYAFVTTKDYPFGTKKWTVVNEPCYQNNETVIDLNLNACSDDEFNCGDGQCVQVCRNKTDFKNLYTYCSTFLPFLRLQNVVMGELLVKTKLMRLTVKWWKLISHILRIFQLLQEQTTVSLKLMSVLTHWLF